MRLILISDIHGLHRELTAAAPLPEGDMLIHAGDFMRTGQQAQEIKDFAYWLQEQPHEHKIVISGNHDLLMESRSGFSSLLTDIGAHYLFDQGCEIDGVRFWGSPWTTRFMDWAFMSDRGPAMRAHWGLIPADTDVLITHGPPQRVLDSSPHYGQDLGCEELRAAVLRIQPKLHVFGHIHAGHGQQWLDQTLCVNAAVLDETYRLAHAPQVVDI